MVKYATLTPAALRHKEVWMRGAVGSSLAKDDLETAEKVEDLPDLGFLGINAWKDRIPKVVPAQHGFLGSEVGVLRGGVLARVQ